LEHLYNIYVEIKHYNSLSPITLEWKIEISPKSIQTVRLSIPITVRSLKWIGQGVLNLWYTNVRPSVSHVALWLKNPLANSLQISQSYWNWWSYGLYALWWKVPRKLRVDPTYIGSSHILKGNSVTLLSISIPK
jgi:hypothetical protein